MEQLLKTAQIQMKVLTKKTDALDLAEKLIEEEVPRDTDLICLPEMFCCPYESIHFPAYAEPEGGPAWRRLSQIARDRGCWLQAGSVPEIDEAGHIYNTAYVFDRTGRQAARHRKTHLFDIDVEGGQHFHESETLTAGDQVTVFETEFGPVGLCICYDIRFPEMVRLMADRGARLILVPAAFNLTTGPLHWELLFRSQAMYSQVYCLGTSDARDPAASYQAWGHTLAADPWGRVTGELDEKPGVLLSTLDLSEADRVRDQIPLLRHRRKDLYHIEWTGKGGDE